MTKPNKITQTTISSDRVGDTKLIGRFGGAYCARYLITAVADGVTTLVPVETEIIINDDGTRSSRFVPVAE